VLAKQLRPQPLERLDAVGDHAFPAREQPAGGDAQAEDGRSTEALTTARTARRQSVPTQRGPETIAHHHAARTKSLARTPEVGTADRVEDDVHSLPRETADLCHEILMPVVDGD